MSDYLADSVDFDPGARVPTLLKGYNSLTGQILWDAQPCVEPLSPDKQGFDHRPAPGSSQFVQYNLNHVTREQDEYQSLNMSASASLKLATGSVKGSYSYFTSGSYSDYDESLRVHVYVENQTTSNTTVRLKHDMETLRATDPLAFLSKCGDRYVSELITGGDFLAFVDFFASTETEQKAISQSLDGAAGTFSASEQMNQKADKVKKLSNYSVNMISKQSAQQLPNGIYQIIDFASKFPTTVQGNNGYVLRAITSSYPAGRTAISPGQYKALDNLAKLIGLAYRRKNGLAYIASHREEFPLVQNSDLRTAQNDNSDMIASLQETGAACLEMKDELKKLKCQSAHFDPIAEVPRRATTITFEKADVQQPEKEILDTSPDDRFFFEMRGEWTQSAANLWLNSNQGIAIRFQSRTDSTNSRSIAAKPGVQYTIPPNTAVFLQVSDAPGYYSDNNVNSNDPLRFIYFDSRPLNPSSSLSTSMKAALSTTVFEDVYRPNLSVNGNVVSDTQGRGNNSIRIVSATFGDVTAHKTCKPDLSLCEGEYVCEFDVPQDLCQVDAQARNLEVHWRCTDGGPERARAASVGSRISISCEP